MLLILLIVLLVLLTGGLAPVWGWHSWGYAPSGILTVILIVIVFLALVGRL